MWLENSNVYQKINRPKNKMNTDFKRKIYNVNASVPIWITYIFSKFYRLTMNWKINNIFNPDGIPRLGQSLVQCTFGDSPLVYHTSSPLTAMRLGRCQDLPHRHNSAATAYSVHSPPWDFGAARTTLSVTSRLLQLTQSTHRHETWSLSGPPSQSQLGCYSLLSTLTAMRLWRCQDLPHSHNSAATAYSVHSPPWDLCAVRTSLTVTTRLLRMTDCHGDISCSALACGACKSC